MCKFAVTTWLTVDSATIPFVVMEMIISFRHEVHGSLITEMALNTIFEKKFKTFHAVHRINFSFKSFGNDSFIQT